MTKNEHREAAYNKKKPKENKPIHVESLDELPWLWLSRSYINVFFGYTWLSTQSTPLIIFGCFILTLGIYGVACLYIILDITNYLPDHCCHPKNVIDSQIWGPCKSPVGIAFFSLDKKVCPQEAQLVQAFFYSAVAVFGLNLVLMPGFLRLLLPMLKYIKVVLTPWKIAFSPSAILLGNHFSILKGDMKIYPKVQISGVVLFIIGIIFLTRFHPDYDASFSCYVGTHNIYKYTRGFCNDPRSKAFQQSGKCAKDGSNQLKQCLYERRLSYEGSVLCILVGLTFWLCMWGYGIRLLFLEVGNRSHVPHKRFDKDGTLGTDLTLFQKAILGIKHNLNKGDHRHRHHHHHHQQHAMRDFQKFKKHHID